MEKLQFIFLICKFLAEVTKVKDGTEYPGQTLYHLVVSIQKFLNEKGKYWKIIEGKEFVEVHNVLDNLMKQRARNNIGTVRRQAQMISMKHEDELWGKGILSEDSPDKLCDTVLFLLGINLGLRAVDEHYYLRRECLEKASQIQFEFNEEGTKCLVYREDCVSKMNDGGLKHMWKERKVVWVYPSKNIERCPVRLVDKYMRLCPMVTPKTKKFNFCLRSLEKPTFTQLYGEQCVGMHTLSKTVKQMLKSANLDGFFTNHSLRHSGTSRLFQNGVDRKLVKEYIGHVSDAVDCYQVTSDE